MDINVFTIFPEMLTGPLNTSILKKAQDRGLVTFQTTNFRQYSTSKHRNVDDTPFGGGAGMVLKPEPIFYALEGELGPLKDYDGKIILMSPQGESFHQGIAIELARERKLAFICGHYEGFDERIRSIVHREISIGDYVLTGGELPAMVVIDAVCRLLPGVLGEEESALSDSFYNGLLEHPHYTRPRSFRGMEVPEVLLSGNHEQIRIWRRFQSLKRTLERRPDLLDRMELSQEDRKLLARLTNMAKEETENGQ